MSSITTAPECTTTEMEFLVLYGGQTKLVQITRKEDLRSLIGQVNCLFQLNINQMGLQLQFYDMEFDTFIDLDQSTWLKFENNRQMLFNRMNGSSLEIKRDPKRRLKLVQKAQSHLANFTDPIQRQISADASFVMVPMNTPAHHGHGISQQAEQMQQSVHIDWILNKLVWILPILGVLSFIGDGIWLIMAFKEDSDEQHNYAGLASTLLILFYYLHYEAEFRYKIAFALYQLFILISIVAGDALHAHYYMKLAKDPFKMSIFIIYAVIDSLFVVAIYYLKARLGHEVSMKVTIENLFHLMSRLEILIIILIPIFTTYDVVTTNTIAFFVLYEFFSHYYNNPDLTYGLVWFLSFWALIILSTATVICENFHFVYYRHAHDAPKNASLSSVYHRFHTLSSSSNGNDDKTAERLEKAAECLELGATLACYSLLLLQFFSKTRKRNEKKQTENKANMNNERSLLLESEHEQHE